MKKLRHLIRRLGALFDKPTKVRFIFAMVVSLILALLDTVAVLLMLPLVDLATGVPPTTGLEIGLKHFFGDPPIKGLVVYVAILTIGLFVLKDIGAMAFNWWSGGFTGRTQVATSVQIMRHYLASPYTEISRRSSAELMRTMNDAVGRVYGNVVNGLMQLAIQGLTMVGIAAALLISAPIPTAALIVYLGIASFLYLKVMKPKARQAGIAAAEASKAGYRAAFEALGGIKETQVRGSEEVFASRYEEASKQSVRPSQVAGFINAAPKYLVEMLFIIAVGVLLVSTVATKEPGSAGGTVVGLLATFVAGGFRALPAVTAVLASLSIFRVGLPYLDLVEAEMKDVAAERAKAPTGPATRMPFAREIAVDDVHFSYPGAPRAALDGVSVTLPYGSSLALAGSSGAGKTTLVDTLLGLHSPETGSITVDGRSIDADPRAWQANIGYVPQEVFILDATLAENIAFDETHDQVDTDRLASAIAHAQLDDVVANLPDGVNTYIGERGSRLSGGQRQRVGIARALYRNPTMLVLDEATSALDNETEHRITQAINGLRGTVTVVIVAHRLSTARHADQLAFMADGKIVTTGTFEEVRDQNADFARLVELGTLA